MPSGLSGLQVSVKHAGTNEMHDMGVAFKQHWPQGSTQDILSPVDVHATAVSLSTGTDVLRAFMAPTLLSSVPC